MRALKFSTRRSLCRLQLKFVQTTAEVCTDYSWSLYRLQLKFVQTTAEVCTDYSWSLQKVLRTYKFNYVYSLKCLRVSIKVSTCTYDNEYDVFISVSARTYKSHLTKTRISHARIYPNEPWIGYVLAYYCPIKVFRWKILFSFYRTANLTTS